MSSLNPPMQACSAVFFCDLFAAAFVSGLVAAFAVASVVPLFGVPRFRCVEVVGWSCFVGDKSGGSYLAVHVSGIFVHARTWEDGMHAYISKKRILRDKWGWN